MELNFLKQFHVALRMDALSAKKQVVREWVKESRKNVKQDFIAFVNFHNENKAELNLTNSEMEALRRLHEMWKIAHTMYEVDFYFNMKDQHTVLNGKLLENSIWRTYIDNFMKFRVSLLSKTTMSGFNTF